MTEPVRTPSLLASLKDQPREAWFLYAGTFVNRFGTFVVPFLLLYLTRRGYSAAEAGAAVGAYGVGSIGASAAGGWTADRLGHRNSIAISMFSSAAVMLLLSQARTLPLIVVLTALAGFAAELYRPAVSALLADIIPPEGRITTFALLRFFINLGFAAGPATAGFLAGRSFFLLFVADAITSAVFGVIALIALPEGTRSRRTDEQPGEARRAILADRDFVRFLVASVLISFIYMQGTSTFALHVRDAGFSEAVYGFLVSLNGIVVVLLELPLTQLTRRGPQRIVIAFGTILVGLGFGLTAVAHAIVPLAATVVIWTLGEIVNAPVASAYVAGLAPPHLRGRYQGAWGSTWSAGLILAPSLGGALYAWSPTGLWTICGLLGMGAALLVLTTRTPAPSERSPST